MGKKIAYKANRHGVAERFPDPAVQKSIAVDLALLGHDDQLLRNVELSILKTAKQHTAQPLYLLRTVPGIGELLSLVLRSDIHAIARFPRGHACPSYCRLVKCTTESAGKRDGTAGPKSGNVHLTWAFAEAAVLVLRDHPVGQQHLSKLAKKPGSGNAVTLRAQKLGRAVYDRLTRPTACARGKFLTGSGSGADEPNASLDNHGLSLRVVRCNAWSLRP
jgi:transposase